MQEFNVKKDVLFLSNIINFTQKPLVTKELAKSTAILSVPAPLANDSIKKTINFIKNNLRNYSFIPESISFRDVLFLTNTDKYKQVPIISIEKANIILKKAKCIHVNTLF